MHRLGERKSKFESLSYVNPDQALPRMARSARVAYMASLGVVASLR